MTELYIDGIRVVLPDNMSDEVKRENSFFTKNGEYTYDITLNLSNKINAELYKHLNRLNSVFEVETKRNAILIADNRVYCNGTEIVTAWTDETVSIQIASGNSELNYFIGSDLKISSLKLCSDSPISTTPNKDMITKLYPDIDACLSPILNRTTGAMVNEWILNKNTTSGVYDLRNSPGFSDYDYISQPFLCAFIKKLLTAIGYTLTVNDLDKTVWKDLFICHLNETREWGEMLPGWTVKDFLEQVESLFNASFIIDSRKKTAKLILNNSFYINTEMKHVQMVIDEYEAEVEEGDQSQLHQNSNIKYSLPDNSYYRHRCLPSTISKNAKRVTIPKAYADIAGGLNYLYFWFCDAANQDKNTIYNDESTGKEYIFEQVIEGILPNPIYHSVNEFASIERDNASSDIELEIIPVELSMWQWHMYENNARVEGTYTPWWVPTIDKEGTTTEETVTSESDLDTQITNGVSDATETKGKIFLAFHRGLNNSGPTWVPNNSFPMAFTDDIIPDEFGAPKTTNAEGATLRITNFEKALYSGVYEIDETKRITITSYDPNVYDTRGIFEIRNKRYVCREMDYTLTSKGRKEAWKGIFHPIKISDIDSYQRWILADGKWRNGGAWLDNGRWLD